MQKLFTNDKFFLITTLFALIGGAFFFVVKCAIGSEFVSAWIFQILSLICLAVIYVSYKRHSKNVMKGMLGAFFMAQIAFPIQVVATTTASADKVFSALYLVAVVALFVGHFIINSDRHPSPETVNLNQIMVLVLALMYAFWSVVELGGAEQLIDKIAIIEFIVAFVCMLAAVVCVESRLDSFRVNRESAGWTDEKGYPEGYVHECDKNK